MRSSSRTPSSCSSCCTALLTVGCVACKRAAAREKPPCRTTSTKTRNRRESSAIPIWNGFYSWNSFFRQEAPAHNRRERMVLDAKKTEAEALRSLSAREREVLVLVVQ